MPFQDLDCPAQEGGDECFPLFLVDDATCKDPCKEIFVGCPVPIFLQTSRAVIVLITRLPALTIRRIIDNEMHAVIVLITRIDEGGIKRDIILPTSRAVIVLITRLSQRPVLRFFMQTSRAVIVLITRVDRITMTLSLLDQHAEIILITRIDKSDITLNHQLQTSRAVIVLITRMDINDFTFAKVLQTSRAVIVLIIPNGSVPVVLVPKADGKGVIVLITRIDKADIDLNIPILPSKAVIVLITKIDGATISLERFVPTSRAVIVLLTRIKASDISLDNDATVPTSRGVIVLVIPGTGGQLGGGTVPVVLTQAGVPTNPRFQNAFDGRALGCVGNDFLIVARENEIFSISQGIGSTGGFFTPLVSPIATLSFAAMGIDPVNMFTIEGGFGMVTNHINRTYIAGRSLFDQNDIAIAIIGNDAAGVLSVLATVTVAVTTPTGPASALDIYWSEADNEIYVSIGNDQRQVVVFDVSGDFFSFAGARLPIRGLNQGYRQGKKFSMNVAVGLQIGDPVNSINNHFVSDSFNSGRITGTTSTVIEQRVYIDHFSNLTVLMFANDVISGGTAGFYLYRVGAAGSFTFLDFLPRPPGTIGGAFFKNGFFFAPSVPPDINNLSVYNVTGGTFNRIAEVDLGFFANSDYAVDHCNDTLFLIGPTPSITGGMSAHDLVL